ncbi:kelch-like protein 34 [Menidia menidia]
MERYSLLHSAPHGAALLAGFGRLRGDALLCDVVLEAGGVAFPCHRALLASASRYFWALFNHEEAALESSPGNGRRATGAVRLPALTAAGLDAVLDFLYSGWLSVSGATLPAVLEAASYLQLDGALALCERKMADGVHLANCCLYANLAERHALGAAVRGAADRAVARETAALLRERRRGDLLALNDRSMAALLDAEEIPGVREAELIELALDWLDENGPLPLLKSNLLISRLRFGLAAPDELVALARRRHVAMATPLVRSQLARAMEYHALGDARPAAQTRQSTPRAWPGRVLLLGPDWPERRALAFDPRSLKFWAPPGLALPRRLRGFCTCSVGGFLFVLGGEELEPEEGGGGKEPVAAATTAKVHRYDPRFGRWEEAAAMLERRARFACCVVGGVVYAVGGSRTPLAIGDHGNHGNHGNQSELKAKLPGDPANPPANPSSTASVEFYDPSAGAWRRAAPLPRPLSSHAAAALQGAVYVSGGLVEPGGASREMLSWDLKARAWEKRAAMFVERSGHKMAAAGGRLYALLGDHEPFCEIERYEPPADEWTRLRPLPGGRSGYGLVASPGATGGGGGLLVFGGKRWSGGREEAVRSVLEYDARKDRWAEICQMPRALSGAQCTLMPVPD